MRSKVVSALVLSFILIGATSVQKCKANEMVTVFKDDFDDYSVNTQPSRWANDWGSVNQGGYYTVINITDKNSVSSPNSLYIGADMADGKYSPSCSITILGEPIAFSLLFKSLNQFNGGVRHGYGTYVRVLDSQNKEICHLRAGATCGESYYHMFVSNYSYWVEWHPPGEEGGWRHCWENEIEIFSALDGGVEWNSLRILLLNETHFKIFWATPTSLGELTLRRNPGTGSVSKFELSITKCGNAYFDNLVVERPLAGPSVPEITIDTVLLLSIAFTAHLMALRRRKRRTHQPTTASFP